MFVTTGHVFETNAPTAAYEPFGASWIDDVFVHTKPNGQSLVFVDPLGQ